MSEREPTRPGLPDLVRPMLADAGSHHRRLAPGHGRRAGRIGSLILGVPDEHGDLQHVGGVGTGFTERMLDQLAQILAPLQQDDSPFPTPLPRAETRDAIWVRPDLVGEVAYAEWTGDGHLRHPSWRGLRPDKVPRRVHGE